MKHKTLTIAAAAFAVLFSAQTAPACTGITLKTADGNTVMARTIEWAANDNHNRYVVVPRGHVWRSLAPDGGEGRKFTARYGYVGFAVEQDEFIVEGLNEKGLSAGLFYFPGYGQYEDFDRRNIATSIADLQLVPFILGSCGTIDEVKQAVANAHIHNIDPRASTAHWRFGEPSGRQIVLEIIGGKCVFYENTLGVLTNSPSFDWQLTNLNNYVNLRTGTIAANKIGTMELRSFGGGSGLHGIPGDVTPPSRFVRAAFYQCSSPTQPNADAAVAQAFHILNNFDLPIGIQTLQGDTPTDIPSATQWTSATDLSGRKIYFRTMYNSHIRCIDLNNIDFKRVEFTSKMMDESKTEPVEMLF